MQSTPRFGLGSTEDCLSILYGHFKSDHPHTKGGAARGWGLGKQLIGALLYYETSERDILFVMARGIRWMQSLSPSSHPSRESWGMFNLCITGAIEN